MTAMVSCYKCELVYEEAELLKCGDLDACPYCRSTDIEDVIACETCDEQPAAEGSDNCAECDDILERKEKQMVAIDDLTEPRLLRDIDQRNIALWASWWARFQMRASYADLRGELTGPKLDACLVQKLRLARHTLNKVQADQRAKAFKERVAKTGNVVSIFHKKQAG